MDDLEFRRRLNQLKVEFEIVRLKLVTEPWYINLAALVEHIGKVQQLMRERDHLKNNVINFKIDRFEWALNKVMSKVNFKIEEAKRL